MKHINIVLYSFKSQSCLKIIKNFNFSYIPLRISKHYTSLQFNQIINFLKIKCPRFIIRYIILESAFKMFAPIIIRRPDIKETYIIKYRQLGHLDKLDELINRTSKFIIICENYDAPSGLFVKCVNHFMKCGEYLKHMFHE